MKVVVDAMGSDRAPGPEVAGALQVVRAHAIDVVLVGDLALRQELEKSPMARLGSALVAPALQSVANSIDYTEIGGALLAGVGGPAVIAHGRSDANAIASAIRAAARFAERSLPAQLAAGISALG